MMVDAQTNSVYEVNTEAEPPGPDNFCGNAFFAKSTLLENESASYAGCLRRLFSVTPAGFFDRNPAIDIPPTSSAHEGCSTAQQTKD
jgi:Cu2+-containing amine oxidase